MRTLPGMQKVNICFVIFYRANQKPRTARSFRICDAELLFLYGGGFGEFGRNDGEVDPERAALAEFGIGAEVE